MRDTIWGKLGASLLCLLASCTLLYTSEEHGEHAEAPVSAAVESEVPVDRSLWAKVGASVAALLGGTGAAWKWKRGKG